MIWPVGVGFTSRGPTGALGFTMTTGRSFARKFRPRSFRLPFGALVMVGHSASETASASVGRHDLAVHFLRQADAADGAGVDDALAAGVPAASMHVARALDVGAHTSARNRAATNGSSPRNENTSRTRPSRVGATRGRSRRRSPVRYPARQPAQSLSGRTSAFTRCPRASSSWTRFEPMKPEAPVTKHFIIRKAELRQFCGDSAARTPQKFFASAGLTWSARLGKTASVVCRPKAVPEKN